jgi:hypothetical protein
MHSYNGMPSALMESMCDIEPDTAMPAPDVVVRVASEFGLNNKQQVAYRIICDFSLLDMSTDKLVQATLGDS